MAITKFDVEFKSFQRKTITFSGTVKVEGTLATRVVCLYKESTGELIDSVISSPITGAWSIDVSDNTNVKYYAICIPTSSSRNAQVFAGLTGV
jgi:hypothetical protein